MKIILKQAVTTRGEAVRRVALITEDGIARLAEIERQVGGGWRVVPARDRHVRARAIAAFLGEGEAA